MDKVVSIILQDFHCREVGNEAIISGTEVRNVAFYTFDLTKLRAETRDRSLTGSHSRSGRLDIMAPDNLLYGFPDLSRFHHTMSG